MQDGDEAVGSDVMDMEPQQAEFEDENDEQFTTPPLSPAQ